MERRRRTVEGVALSDILTRAKIAQLCNVTPARKAFWSGKRALVTGATGMLGSWLTHALVEAGAIVTIVVRDRVSASLLYADDTLARVTVVHGSFEDEKLVGRAMSEYEPEFLFHIGAQTQVRTANRDPVPTFEANIRGTWVVLEAARRSPTIKGVLLASSDKAYGAQPILPYTEAASMNGAHPYDVSKSCADLLARAYAHTYKLPVCVTRCGNLYGPGDRNFDRIIPGTIRSIVRGERPIIRSDGKFVRDYFFTPDAVDGYLAIAESMHRPDVVGQAFNLSTGNGLTVLDLFDRIIDALDADIEPEVLNQASNEIRAQTLSSDKAAEILGWHARHTIDDGLRITVEWYRAWLVAQGEARLEGARR